MPVDVLLLDIVVILIAARLLGWLARKVGQPAVIGEILAGILLGPTLLGHFGGDMLFPPEVMPALEALADMGLLLFMFVVGLELDQKVIRAKGRAAVSVAGGSILLPFGLGIVLALWLVGEHGGDHPVAFVAFLGVAMAVTALPVLARMLTDREMEQTEIGGLALASGAVVDVFAWVVFAIVVALAGTGEPGQWHTILVIPYVAVMILVVKPLLKRLVPAFNKAGRLTPGLLAIVLIGLIASSLATEWMHIHFIFGAFLFGAVLPREGAEQFTHEILERLEQLAVLLLLPMFFVISGLSVDLSALNVSDIGVLGAIFGVAIGGKIIGTYGAARMARLPNRQAFLLANLMNGRGLTALVILIVGLEKGLIGEELFSLMVLMAIVTTAIAGWMSKVVYSDRRIARDIAEAERAALGVHAAYRSMVMVPAPATDAPMARIAMGLTRGAPAAEVVLGHLRPYPKGTVEVGTGLSSELADMAGALGELESLASGVSTDDVPARVLSRFARDPRAELPELVEAADPDVVVLPSDLPGHESVGDVVSGRVVTAREDWWHDQEHLEAVTAGPVAVLYPGGTAADIAAEMALRLAVSAGRTLVLVGGRRADGLAERLRRFGVDARSEPTVPEGALLVAADSRREDDDETAAPHLLVRAEQDADPVDWEQAASKVLFRAEEPSPAG